MKDDTISRQVAINAAVKMFEAWYGGSVLWDREIRARFDALPPAQPGWITDVNDILVYLNGVVHPLVSPENWNVYSELYDMVSGLLNPWEGGQDGD